MRIRLLAVVLALATLSGASAANAITLSEDFEAVPFGLWESGWFGTQSNAQNYYVVNNGASIDNRGNNPDGLWVADGGASTPVTILFNPSFAASLSLFSFDVASYTQSTLTISTRTVQFSCRPSSA